MRVDIVLMLLPILLSAVVGFAMAIVLVEKQEQWPATFMRPSLIWVLGKINSKLPDMLNCSTCTSFWTTLIADLGVSLYTGFKYTVSWPLSGFVAVALTWTIIELLNAIDPKKDPPKDTSTNAN